MNKNSFVNKYKNLCLINVLAKKSSLLPLSLSSRIKRSKIRNKKDSLVVANRNSAHLFNSIFNKIKYKKLGGVRIRVKGRLSKRYRADRAVYLLK